MRKVLVVDDSQSVRNELADLLENEGFEVLEAADATEAFACLSRHRDISLMVLDVNMPGMSGIDALEQIRREGDSDLPVLMLTTEAERSLIDRAKQAGAKGWLLKPIKGQLLVATVSRLAR